MEVDALGCPECEEIHLTGATARAITARWYAVGTVETPVLPAVTDDTVALPLIEATWAWARPLATQTT